VEDRKQGFRLHLPAAAAVDAQPRESRALQAVLDDTSRPRPIFRIDAFTPDEEDPVAVDLQYARDYFDHYGALAFNGRFTPTDGGLLVLPKKLDLALVGGGYLQGAANAYRLQAVHLAREQQLFLTFDCAEGAREHYFPTIARILLSFEVTGRR
jgi:hypothetical protein